MGMEFWRPESKEPVEIDHSTSHQKKLDLKLETQKLHQKLSKMS